MKPALRTPDPDISIDAILDKWRTDPDQALILADRNRETNARKEKDAK